MRLLWVAGVEYVFRSWSWQPWNDGTWFWGVCFPKHNLLIKCQSHDFWTCTCMWLTELLEREYPSTMGFKWLSFQQTAFSAKQLLCDSAVKEAHDRPTGECGFKHRTGLAALIDSAANTLMAFGGPVCDVRRSYRLEGHLLGDWQLEELKVIIVYYSYLNLSKPFWSWIISIVSDP